jgi:hypothetical protein
MHYSKVRDRIIVDVKRNQIFDEQNLLLFLSD